MNPRPSPHDLIPGPGLTYEQHRQIARLGQAARIQREAIYIPKQQRQIEEGLRADVDPEMI